jgi:hypothetical protein
LAAEITIKPLALEFSPRVVRTRVLKNEIETEMEWIFGNMNQDL